MFTTSLPAASNNSTWIESIEYFDIEDNEPIDFSLYEDIRLILGPGCGGHGLTLTKARGQITTPSPGLIMWCTELGNFNAGLYKLRLTVKIDETTTLLLLNSHVTIVE